MHHILQSKFIQLFFNPC